MSPNFAILALSTTLRTYARKLGIIKVFLLLDDFLTKLTGNTTPYELRFDNAMLSEIKPADVIWDVGANLGLYTKKFSDAVGNKGSVYAFEPAPTCFQTLQNSCSNLTNIVFYNVALGECEKKLTFYMANDALAPTHSLVNIAPSENNVTTIDIHVKSGDDILLQDKIPCPQVIKIDVEGYEEEVLRGLSNTLANAKCRTVFCEIHFSLLCQKGQKNAPARIMKFLQNLNFRTKWIDRSHLAAYKKH